MVELLKYYGDPEQLIADNSLDTMEQMNSSQQQLALIDEKIPINYSPGMASNASRARNGPGSKARSVINQRNLNQSASYQGTLAED